MNLSTCIYSLLIYTYIYIFCLYISTYTFIIICTYIVFTPNEYILCTPRIISL